MFIKFCTNLTGHAVVPLMSYEIYLLDLEAIGKFFLTAFFPF